MPTWLVDEPSTVYLILGFVALGLLFAYWKTRERRWAIGLGVVVALAGLVWLLGFLIVTDRKQILHSLDEMKAGVKTRDLDRVFAHISDQFNASGLTKRGLRAVAERALRDQLVDEVRIWEINPGEISRPNRIAKITFDVKVTGPNIPSEQFYHCEAVFVLDPDAQWRLQTFILRNPVNNQPVPVPRR